MRGPSQGEGRAVQHRAPDPQHEEVVGAEVRHLEPAELRGAAEAAGHRAEVPCGLHLCWR